MSSIDDDLWSVLAASGHDLPRLLAVIAERVVGVLGDGCVITMVGEDGATLVPQAVLHSDPAVSGAMGAALRSQHVRLGEGVAGTAAADRRSIVLNDLPPATVERTTPERFLPFVRDHPMRAMMIAPMVAAGELVGTIGSLRTESEEPYTAADLRLLEGLAAHAAPAVAEALHGPRSIGLTDYVAIFQHTLDGVLLTTPDGHVLAANPAACAILGRTEREIVRGGRDEVVVADERLARGLAERVANGRVRTELLMRRSDGETFLADVASVLYTDAGGKVRTVTVFRDISAEVAARELTTAHLDELRQAADRDPLTGLWNRRGFAIAATQAFAEADRAGTVCQVVFVDVDGLKALNDAHGHAAGDDALVALATAIGHALREADVACRLGGDEFVFIALDTPASAIDALVDRIDGMLATAPVAAPLTFSFGVAERAPGSEASLDALVEAADHDMYRNKVLRRLGGAG